jgi:crotonobetainyl-CoA:carnitine CoA-transferase CaiB-like acyl-CoA transferase
MAPEDVTALLHEAGVGSPDLTAEIADEDVWHSRRDEAFALLGPIFRTHTTAHWLQRIAGVKGWCVEVLKWTDLVESPVFRALEQTTAGPTPRHVAVLRAPFRIDGERPDTEPAPLLDDNGAHLRAHGWD